ncbi:hypothetical protein F0562_020868 [Nyssa sinensis]|uniref:Uncharacterized protein n=1 Tax=Nyssa sinensis TaxID=561372 RepID=A0A5J5BVS0_9ASTE|nr:hypothetical protein F0562_020868 [Nyssa sinensis]
MVVPDDDSNQIRRGSYGDISLSGLVGLFYRVLWPNEKLKKNSQKHKTCLTVCQKEEKILLKYIL